MNLPLFHDPLAGTVTVDMPLRDPKVGREAAFRRDRSPRDLTPRQSLKPKHGAAILTRSARQRKVADDLQALMARATGGH